MMNIVLVYVESPYFRELLLYYYLGLEPYLIKSANTIKDQILKEFRRQKLEIKKKLVAARSRIYISANLQTSLNSLLLIRIIAYYLDKDLIKKSTLISLRRIKGAYSSENITKVIIPVLEEIGISSRLEYFIGDNYQHINALALVQLSYKPRIGGLAPRLL